MQVSIALSKNRGKNTRECSTFWLIKLTLDLVSVADFFTTDITKQVLNVNGELLKALHW